MNPYNNYQMYQQNQPMYAQQTPQMTAPMQSNFISVPNEYDARNYPVGHGNSITFKDENAPYIYVKTMGFSQLDRPVFEKYRLVKEEDEIKQNVVNDQTKDEVTEEILEEIEALKSEIQSIKKQIKGIPKSTTRKTTKEDEEDE